MLTSEQIIELLQLQPLQQEGGYFNEIYRSGGIIPKEVLPPHYCGSRNFATSIYYLVTPDSFSVLHRILSDEIFHFYLGDPVEMLQLLPDGTGQIITMGSDIQQGMQLQVVVPQGIWQGIRLKGEGRFALLGTTVAPGFEYEDYENGFRDRLIHAYPEFEDLIKKYTRK